MSDIRHLVKPKAKRTKPTSQFDYLAASEELHVVLAVCHDSEFPICYTAKNDYSPLKLGLRVRRAVLSTIFQMYSHSIGDLDCIESWNPSYSACTEAAYVAFINDLKTTIKEWGAKDGYAWKYVGRYIRGLGSVDPEVLYMLMESLVYTQDAPHSFSVWSSDCRTDTSRPPFHITCALLMATAVGTKPEPPQPVQRRSRERSRSRERMSYGEAAQAIVDADCVEKDENGFKLLQ